MRIFANAKSRRADWDTQGIVSRVRQLREARFGPRGQSHFCRAIGISPSSYFYYEKSRVPPPGLLVRMAQVGSASLAWLLTGQGSMDTPETKANGSAGQVLERVSRLLQDRGAGSRALAAFVELLDRIEDVERNRRKPPVSVDPPGDLPQRVRIPPVIPVLGRAAAAVPQFWANPKDGTELTNQLGQAMARLDQGERLEGKSQTLGTRARPYNVALVQLARPVELAGLSVAEVLESPRLVAKWPEAFALRIEGDSMAPMLQDRDLVLLSPKRTARDGEPAVVQLANQIGVACKVYRRVRKQVRLIPANAAYPTTVHDSGEVTWALRVLARVRL